MRTEKDNTTSPTQRRAEQVLGNGPGGPALSPHPAAPDVFHAHRAQRCRKAPPAWLPLRAPQGLVHPGTGRAAGDPRDQPVAAAGSATAHRDRLVGGRTAATPHCDGWRTCSTRRPRSLTAVTRRSCAWRRTGSYPGCFTRLRLVDEVQLSSSSDRVRSVVDAHFLVGALGPFFGRRARDAQLVGDHCERHAGR